MHSISSGQLLPPDFGQFVPSNFVIVKTKMLSRWHVEDPMNLTLEDMFDLTSFWTKTEFRELCRQSHADRVLGGFVIADLVTPTVTNDLLGTVVHFNAHTTIGMEYAKAFSGAGVSSLLKLHFVRFSRKYGLAYAVNKNIDFGYTAFACVALIRPLHVKG